MINKLGSFEVKSNKIIVSDPCYSRGTWCAGSIDNAKSGKWSVSTQLSDEGDWGTRVACLKIFHESFKKRNGLDWVEQDADIGVDSGQAGFFCDSEFKGGGDDGDIEWYHKCCELTLSDDKAGLLPGGVVSSSGYGDGSYTLYTITENGHVVAAKLKFI